MADWPLQTLGGGGGALELAVLLAPLFLALLLAWSARAPADGAEFDGRAGELSAWSVGFSLAASDLALGAALLVLPLASALPGGGLACLQGIVIGGLLGRFVASRWMLPACFETRERSALARIGERLGSRAEALAAAVFAGGALLASAARVFLFVFALHLVLGGSLGFGALAVCVWAAAALLALVRGLRGSIRGDGVLLGVLAAAAVAGLAGLVSRLEGGWGRLAEALHVTRKDVWIDFQASAGFEHTFWTALCLASLASAAHYGADPVQLTRLLATGSLARARKALWISLAGALPAVALCLVGPALYAWGEQPKDPNAAIDALAAAFEGARWPALVASELPRWPRALVLAGIAASAVVAAKSLLGALVQVAAALRRRRRGVETSLAGMRLMTVASAAVLLGVGLALQPRIAEQPLLLERLSLAGECALGLVFGATALALLRRPPAAEGLLWAAPLALVGVFLFALHGPVAERAALGFAAAYLLAWSGWRFLPDWFGHRRRAGALVELAAVAAALVLLVWGVRWGLVPIERHFRHDPEWVWLPLSPAWYVPAGGWIGFVFGCLLARGSAGSGEGIAQTPAR